SAENFSSGSSSVLLRQQLFFSGSRERARAANQEQISGIRVDLDEEETNDVDRYEKEHFTNPNDEASDESDDLQSMDSVMFPKSSLKR
ncbi:hypothetical protein HAX54_012123, partial [Datura stramonium]|nr:hypothetical protein [Datura stramonium]